MRYSLPLAMLYSMGFLAPVCPARAEDRAASSPPSQRSSAPAGDAAAPNGSAEWISQQVEILSSKAPRSRSIFDAIALARNALAKSKTYRRAGQPAAADRATRIAWAAYVLASRRTARAISEDALRKAEQRAAEAELVRKRAREALEASLQQRALLLEEAH